MSDDGEPSGTAGKPILFSLQRAELTNVILVVVRYFGGVRLGVGPLARAFTEAATGAIQNADILQIVPRKRLMLNCEYDDVSRIVELLKEVEASYEVMYTDAVQFDVEVDEPHYEKLTSEVVERTAGRAGFSEITAE